MQQTNIKAIGVTQKGNTDILQQVTIPKPKLNPHDILVRVKGVALNPIDFKVRAGAFNEATKENPKVLGYDGSGVVAELGSEVKGLKVGDEVFYAGDISRNGSQSEYQAVDSRIVGFKPKKLSHGEAASIPLVFLTAYEGLVDRLKISPNPADNKGKNILIVAGAGGVGSIAIQIAKHVLGLTVIATASRPETISFVKKLGADYVVNHRKPLKEGFEQHKLKDVDYVFHTWDLDNDYLKQLSDLAKPFAPIGFIWPIAGLDLMPVFLKAQSLVGELMFVRPLHLVHPERQGEILNIGSKLLDDGKIKHVTVVSKYSVQALREGHKLLESGKTIGKLSYSFE